MAAPTIPPRPARIQNMPASSANMDMPKIPPRPKRSVERSISPHRDSFARSPLNDPSFLHNGLIHDHNKDSLSSNLPQRPPSVTLPSIGQEGSEYANLQSFSDDGSPEQTKNVAGDLPLHAPTASMPSSTAKSRIAAVTRTDSSQAAAAGIGKPCADADEKAGAATSIRSSSSTGTHTRPQSIYKDDEEHGIPEIGLQVPMYPNAGDVQAPTPGPYNQNGPSGNSYFSNGSQPFLRHHSRTKSGREIFTGPPGSYGLHGHGVAPRHEFEKQWYAKHPEDLAKEKQGEYGPAIQDNRKEYNLSQDDLNRIVRESATRGIGMGTSREAIGTPDEQVGYIASEEYASRMASPRPSSARPPPIHTPKARSSSSQSHAESPLRNMSFPAEEGSLKMAAASDHALESEAEEDIIHIDPPSHRTSNVGGGGYDPPTENLGPEGGNTEEAGGWIDERGYGVPILASDEVAKHPAAEYMQPAVSPELERAGTGDYTINDPDGIPSYLTGRKSVSRGSSRNNSIHAGTPGLSRFQGPLDYERSGTPLDDVKEYEPLFPEDDDQDQKKSPENSKTTADNMKRPDALARHQFPSQDVWEDTPSCLQLQTTVESPQLPEEAVTPGEKNAAQVFEDPDAEKNRKEDITEEDQLSFLADHTKRFAKSHFNAEVTADMHTRPGMQHRFPSHDIWEDSPEHHHLVTTVSGPQTEETSEYVEEAAVKTEKPEVPARPTIPPRTGAAKDTSLVEKKAPGIPERPKPQVPVRPAKPLSKTSAEKVPTTTDGGSEAAAAAPVPKAKPAIPARPGGSKIAALKAGFMNDLNSKLGLGPQARKVQEPKKEEEEKEEERAPLADARKGRAKGPQRRKPAASPSGAAVDAAPTMATPTLSFAMPTTVWQMAEDGEVDVPASKAVEALQSISATKPEASAEPAEEKAAEPETVQSPESTSEPLAKTETATSTASDPPVTEELSEPSSANAAVQSGQQDVDISNTDGSKEETAIPLAGKAAEEGSAVAKDGVEHVDEDEGVSEKRIESTSEGM